MAENITTVFIKNKKSLNQCDIFRNVEFIEYIKEEDEIIEVSKIIFPLVMVLTQACDLQQDFAAREKRETDTNGTHDKYLISVIVVPLYNFEDFRQGEHLSKLGFKMEVKGKRGKSLCDNIIKNENKRYHYLSFSKEIELPESVIDFKHYFTVTINYLKQIAETQYVCSVKSLYRELILQRFSNFLARIGLPDANDIP